MAAKNRIQRQLELIAEQNVLVQRQIDLTVERNAMTQRQVAALEKLADHP
jgi:hypothetical protein